MNKFHLAHQFNTSASLETIKFLFNLSRSASLRILNRACSLQLLSPRVSVELPSHPGGLTLVFGRKTKPFYPYKYRVRQCVIRCKGKTKRRHVEDSIQIDLVTVFDATLTSRQTREKLQYLYENIMSIKFRRTTVLKKI